MTEIPMKLTLDDFDRDDRVYCFREKTLYFGKVITVTRYKHRVPLVKISLDIGEDMTLTIEQLQKREVGKVLPLNRLNQGDIVSKWMSITQHRVYYSVDQYVRGESITLKPFRSSQYLKTIVREGSAMELEKQFMNWDLEG